MDHHATSMIFASLIMVSVFTGLVWPCNRAEFDEVVYNYCLPVYNQTMATSNFQHECPWPSTISNYKWLDNCLSVTSNLTSCTDGSLKDQIFLDLHRTYFSLCPFIQDPDVPILMMLILPCIIATFLMSCLCTYLTTSISTKF